MRLRGIALVLAVLALPAASLAAKAPPKNPDIVNDVRVRSHGKPSSPLRCEPGPNEGNRIGEAFAIDPSNPNVLYLGVEYHGVYKSTDGGATWKPSQKGIVNYPRADDPKTGCMLELGKIVIDPRSPRHLLLTRVDSPGLPTDYFSENAGVYESRDAGKTWTKSYKGKLQTYVRFAVAFGDSKTWYAGSYNSPPSHTGSSGVSPNTVGVVNKTADGGKTWKELPTGLVPFVGVQQLFVKPGDPKTVVAYTFARPLEQKVFSEGLGTIRTTDGGKTWAKLENDIPAGDKAPLDVDVAPKDFSHVFYISYGSGSGVGLYSSADGGRTFVRAAFAADARAGIVIARYDPHDGAGNRLLGAGFEGEISSSSDNGRTWKQISALPGGPGGMIARVSVIRWDPKSAQTVYAGGVYQGTAPRVPFLFRSRDGGVSWQSVLDPAVLKP